MADIPTQRKTTLTNAVEMFLLDCEARRLTVQTRSGYARDLRTLQRWCNDNGLTYLDDLDTHHVRQFFVSLAHRGLSGQYQHNIARSVRAWSNFVVAEELVAVSPMRRVKMPKLPKKEIVAFGENDIEVVLRACRTDRDRALCLVLLDTGVRASECIMLDVGDVDLKTGIVKVRQGKGQKDRTVYIGARTRRQLQKYLKSRPHVGDREPLFAGQRIDRLTLSGIVQMMARLAERSGIDHCTAHTFRRTFALACLRNGMNIYVLARMMGHADITVLIKYLKLVEQDGQIQHDQFGVVDHL